MSLSTIFLLAKTFELFSQLSLSSFFINSLKFSVLAVPKVVFTNSSVNSLSLGSKTSIISTLNKAFPFSAANLPSIKTLLETIFTYIAVKQILIFKS